MRIVLFLLLSCPIINLSVPHENYGSNRSVLKHKPVVSPAREEIILYPTIECIEEGYRFVIPIKGGCQRLPTLNRWTYGIKVFTSRSIRFYSNFNCTDPGDHVIVRVIPPEPKTKSKCNDLSHFLLITGSFLPLEHYSLSNNTDTITVVSKDPGKNVT